MHEASLTPTLSRREREKPFPNQPYPITLTP